MKKLSKRLLSTLCTAALLLGLLPLGAITLAADKPTLWLVGDSTVCAFNDAYYYPRFGYGTQIENYLDGSYNIQNLAASGRSSKSYPTDGKNGSKANYDKLIAGMQRGDALIIGFGHNDEKEEEPDRFTSATGTWETEGSFANTLWVNYVKPAQEAGVEVILCTPIVRRNAKALSNGDCHVTSGGDYPAAIKALGQAKGCAVVDLTAKTKALYEELTPTGTLDLHAWTSDDPASVDNTHLNIYGAKKVAWILATELVKTSTELGKHVSATAIATEPSKDADLKPNPDYVHVDYTAPENGSGSLADPAQVVNQADPTGDKLTFYPTAFGDLGGKPTSENFVFTQIDSSTLRIKTPDRGKIASSTEGFAVYYLRLPVGTQFKFSATATIDTLSTNDQAAFGIMARDNMFIDTNNTALIGDYVAAGAFANGTSGSFNRKSGKLNKTDALSAKLVTGQPYDMSIVSNPDGFTCTFADETPQSGGFDFPLTAMDSQYFYLCLFAIRNMEVTFSNISLEMEGESENPGGNGGDSGNSGDSGNVTDAIAGGGLETLFAEIPGVTDKDVTAVSYTNGSTTVNLTGDDFDYLVRDVNGGVRLDIPGVKAGTYSLTVTADGMDYTAEDIQVEAHDRSGFAHYGYTEGVGAYKDDGTLKDNALVVYVTNENKDTVSVSFTRNGDPKTVTGIGNILNSNNSKINQSLLEFMSKEMKRPLVIRFIGDVKAPQGVSEYKKGSSNGSMVYMLSGANVTLEGIGPDATIDGWGFSFGADKDDTQYNKQAKNFEVRNLSFRNVPEDCVEVTGFGNADGSIKESVEHVWVHNNAFYVPHIANPAEDDKAEGDGAVDFKWGRYMTMSYNYFEGYHKTSLIGGSDTNIQYHVTWHHNHWKDVQSRSPLARQADVHIYNNYYEHQTSYCMSLRSSAYIFSEANTFLNCKDVAIDEGTGGAAKSFGDVFTNCTGRNAMVQVTDKAQTIEKPDKNTNPYFGFDTQADSYVAKGTYKLDTAAKALENIAAYGGTMKAAADMTTVPMTASKAQEPTPEVTGVRITSTATSVRMGSTITLKAAVDMSANGVDTQGVYWISGDTKVLTIDGNTGVITPVAEGKATVTAQSNANKTKSASVTITVTAASSGGSGGSSGGSSSASSTVTNPDGSKTTTKTDQNGTVTKTTTKTDGTTEVVETKKDGTVTNTVTKPDGSKTEAVTTKDGDKTVTATDPKGEVVAKVELPATIPAPKEKFTDVPEGHWAEQAINNMAGLGMVNGISETVHFFDMTSAMTRGSIATILYRFSNGAAGKTTTFDDVAAGEWYADAIGWASEVGVVTGYSDSIFAPKDVITREQLAVMIFRFAKLIGMDTNVGNNVLDGFVDADATGTWATDAMTWCTGKGIITGKPGNVLDPAADVSRAEASVMFSRLIALI